jgi:pilus assembly protein CpaE
MATNFEITETITPLRSDSHDSDGATKVSIAIVDPDHDRAKSVAQSLPTAQTGLVLLVPGYLPSLQDAPRLADQGFEMILVGLDGDMHEALQTVQSLCALSPATVVVYSRRAEQELLIQSMRSGAREFLTFPFAPGEVEEAMTRVATRIQASQTPKKTSGKILAFVGAKGGAGVTTVASNYAVALAQDATKNTLLIDFDLPLGDAALAFGLTCEFSTVDALREADRLDSAFLSKLVVRHASGLSLLAAPGRFPHVPIDNVAANRLLTVACDSFDYVVIDAGSRLDWTRTHLFDLASRIYLATQIGIPELRNANRMITGSIPAHGSKLEIVLNRYSPKSVEVADDAIERALTVAPKWRIPNDYHAVREMQSRSEPLALADSPIARVIRQMAGEISGLSNDKDKDKKKSLLGLFG